MPGLLLLIWAGAAPAAYLPEREFIETSNFKVLFPSALKGVAPHFTQCLEAALAFHSKQTGYRPDRKIVVVLWDSQDFGTAWATVSPREKIEADIEPKDLSFETFPSGDRFCRWANHELFHVVNFGQAAPEDARYRHWFRGKISTSDQHPETILYGYLVTPRLLSPPWMTEGAASFIDTYMGGGIGRVQGGYDEMVFRAMVRDGVPFYDPLGLAAEGNEVDFRGSNNNYLYGGRFQSYLAYQYSPEKLFQWWLRGPGSKRDMRAQFEHVFGVPLEQAWQQWVTWEHAFQTHNLAEIRKYPTTPYREISRRALGSVSRAFEDRDARRLYVAVRYPGMVAHIAAISLEDGSLQKLQEIKNPINFRVTSLAFDPKRKILYYTEDNASLRDLMALNVGDGRVTTLMQNARVGDLVFNPADDSLWGVRTARGRHAIVRIAPPYKEVKSVWNYPLGMVVSDLDISPDGRLLSASFGRMNGDQSVRVMSIEAMLAGDVKAKHTFELGTLPESFVFAPDGRSLLGSSYYTGISNIYRFSLTGGKMQALSNAETGFFRPTPLSDGSLMVLNYTGEGFVPVRIEPKSLEDLSAVRFLGAELARKQPAVRKWLPQPADKIDLAALTLSEGKYQAVAGMELDSVYPILEGYKDSIGAGAIARFADPLRYSRVDVSATYTPDGSLDRDEQWHAAVRWDLYRAWAELSWNKADFYDMFGPTKSGRKGYAVTVGYRKPLIYDLPRRMDFNTEISYRGGLDTLPDFQTIGTSYDSLVLAKANLTYMDLRQSQGAVDDESGYQWGLYSRTYVAGGDAYFGLAGRFDVGWPLPLEHSSLWLRSAAGASSGDRGNSLASTYFGSFGNNYVDRLDPKRYREISSLPGFDIDEVRASSFVKSMIEWNLPPLRFSSIGTPNLYPKWLRPALFSTALVTDPDHGRDRRTFYDVGAQFDLAFMLLSRRPLTISLGYAVGFEAGGRSSDELMLSLKIL